MTEIKAEIEEHTKDTLDMLAEATGLTVDQLIDICVDMSVDKLKDKK